MESISLPHESVFDYNESDGASSSPGTSRPAVLLLASRVTVQTPREPPAGGRESPWNRDLLSQLRQSRIKKLPTDSAVDR